MHLHLTILAEVCGQWTVDRILTPSLWEQRLKHQTWEVKQVEFAGVAAWVETTYSPFQDEESLRTQLPVQAGLERKQHFPRLKRMIQGNPLNFTYLGLFLDMLTSANVENKPFLQTVWSSPATIQVATRGILYKPSHLESGFAQILWTILFSGTIDEISASGWGVGHLK